MGGGGNELQRLTGDQNLALGIVSGMMCKSMNYPLLNWKNTVQQGLPISFTPSIVYRGLPMAMINLGGTTGVQFVCTGFFQKRLAGPDGKIDSKKETMAALFGGLVSGIPCCVYELTMIQQQRFGGSIPGTPVRVVKEHGLSILTRGLSTTMGREGLYTMAMLGLTPLIQRGLNESYGMENSMALVAGSLIGAFVSATLSHPMDTIKTCMQGDLGRVKYNNVTQTAKSLVNEYGIANGLFKGLSWRIGLIATTFFLVNKFKVLLAPVLFPVPEVKNKALEAKRV